MRHVLSILVENKPGVLARVAGLFSRRGYNIDSLAVGPTTDTSISRMTIVVKGDDIILEQITKQLNKLIDVIKIIDLTAAQDFVERELVLIKVSSSSQSRSEILEIADIFRAKVVDVAAKSITLETTGSEGKIEALIDLFKKFGIIEIVRTGKIALNRGMK
ncbi:MAG: acetolactate synthase small subunit [Candidatus Margulisiibacteriota bacterium]|nr:MAG: acetolactate synthase small subunit [Candidatus Margulisbacteria bacterium GWF2_38_17]OGI11804.1 MAG: acetolactate synthase small subunit [Candidatus Margulisbacteria bacterium GWE2_39_32]PZM79826.1 MAG: acetolactate synthase small subunit [Candidatus Margulisiibacteriota bacterium]HCT83789.1 acetolactate synthase small subunit [Candidatus Margulisiibacteriota bacterium]HCY37567.1 acetolactate synthase small subunit [Candidatus Margulisiibacteriota bacterium]